MANKSTQCAKTGFLLANRIAKDIIDQNLSPGVLFGREPELLAQYGISRDPFREAVRILEWQGLATSVRGSGGGLRVGNLNPETISNIIRDYLFLSNTSVSDLIAVIKAFTEYGIDLLTTPEHEQIRISLLTLKTSWKDQQSSENDSLKFFKKLLIQLIKYTRNPAIGLFLTPIMDVINNAYTSADESTAFKAPSIQLLFNCIDLAVLGESIKSKFKINSYLDLLEKQYQETLSKTVCEKEFPNWLENSSPKKAQILVYKIHRHIVENQLQPGTKIGLEPDLLERYKVSRAVFREAIRQLEIIGLVEQKKGRSGGLMVSQPSPASLIPVAVVYLFHANFGFEKFDESRKIIEIKSAELAAEKISCDQIITLKKLLENCNRTSAEEYIATSLELHSTLCEFSCNPILAMYMSILAEISKLATRDTDRLERLHKNIHDLKNSQQKVIDAIINKEPNLAKTLMKSHRLLVSHCLR